MPFNLTVKSGSMYTWYLTGIKPMLPIDAEIGYIRIDGDELGYIILKFRNIPVTNGPSCIYTGELARFIYNNL